jgi:hypothetical protein
MSDTRNLKMGERQSCEQLVDVDEPHAKQLNFNEQLDDEQRASRSSMTILE